MSEGGLDAAALVISTEGQFPVTRLRELAAARKVRVPVLRASQRGRRVLHSDCGVQQDATKPQLNLDRVFVKRAGTVEELLHALVSETSCGCTRGCGPVCLTPRTCGTDTRATVGGLPWAANRVSGRRLAGWRSEG